MVKNFYENPFGSGKPGVVSKAASAVSYAVLPNIENVLVEVERSLGEVERNRSGQGVAAIVVGCMNGMIRERINTLRDLSLLIGTSVAVVSLTVIYALHQLMLSAKRKGDEILETAVDKYEDTKEKVIERKQKALEATEGKREKVKEWAGNVVEDIKKRAGISDQSEVSTESATVPGKDSSASDEGLVRQPSARQRVADWKGKVTRIVRKSTSSNDSREISDATVKGEREYAKAPRVLATGDSNIQPAEEHAGAPVDAPVDTPADR